MKAVMVRKACNVKDWQDIVNQFKLDKSQVKIEKTIEISDEEFKKLCDDFFEYRDYITENLKHMYMEEGVWHCILVKGKTSDIGLLIESEGYDYARYTGLIKLSEVRNG